VLAPSSAFARRGTLVRVWSLEAVPCVTALGRLEERYTAGVQRTENRHPVIDAGYFAKRIMPKPGDMSATGVREICSVSECISSGPPDWIERWLHNEFGWFNHIRDALSVIPTGHEAEYRLFAYRLHPEVFRHDVRVPLTLPEDVRPDRILATFHTLGFDSASKSIESGLGLECSPLSCNSMAAEIGTNEFCLFPTLGEAVAGAEQFAREQPEPGDYYVVEVLESKPDAV